MEGEPGPMSHEREQPGPPEQQQRREQKNAAKADRLATKAAGQRAVGSGGDTGSKRGGDRHLCTHTLSAQPSRRRRAASGRPEQLVALCSSKARYRCTDAD